MVLFCKGGQGNKPFKGRLGKPKTGKGLSGEKKTLCTASKIKPWAYILENTTTPPPVSTDDIWGEKK
jgi:hypothetical protein